MTCLILAFQNTSEKVTLYRAILEQFPVVTYKTLRRLLGHLYFIQSQSVRNLMPMDNLAAIWGPTIVQHEVSIMQYKLYTVSNFEDNCWSLYTGKTYKQMIDHYSQSYSL